MKTKDLVMAYKNVQDLEHSVTKAVSNYLLYIQNVEHELNASIIDYENVRNFDSTFERERIFREQSCEIPARLRELIARSAIKEMEIS